MTSADPPGATAIAIAPAGRPASSPPPLVKEESLPPEEPGGSGARRTRGGAAPRAWLPVQVVDGGGGGEEVVFGRSFATAEDALASLRAATEHHGFGVRRRSSKENFVYVVCSREGIPEAKKDTGRRRRNRASDRCGCPWRVTLHLAAEKSWAFRRGTVMTHNHPLCAADARDLGSGLPHRAFRQRKPRASSSPADPAESGSLRPLPTQPLSQPPGEPGFPPRGQPGYFIVPLAPLPFPTQQQQQQHQHQHQHQQNEQLQQLQHQEQPQAPPTYAPVQAFDIGFRRHTQPQTGHPLAGHAADAAGGRGARLGVVCRPPPAEEELRNLQTLAALADTRLSVLVAADRGSPSRAGGVGGGKGSAAEDDFGRPASRRNHQPAVRTYDDGLAVAAEYQQPQQQHQPWKHEEERKPRLGARTPQLYLLPKTPAAGSGGAAALTSRP